MKHPGTAKGTGGLTEADRADLSWLSRRQLAIAAAALVMVVLTWLGTLAAIRAERREAEAHLAADVSNTNRTFEEMVRREFLAADRVVRTVEHDWERRPAAFSLDSLPAGALRSRYPIEVKVTDENGIIVDATNRSKIGDTVAHEDYFQHERDQPADDGKTFIGSALQEPSPGIWAITVARRLDEPSGRFAGAAIASYQMPVLTDFLGHADIGADGVFAIINGAGVMRAVVGTRPVEVDSITGTPFFAAINQTDAGRWMGPSPFDGVRRMYAFRRLFDQDLIVAVGFNSDEALRSSTLWENGAVAFAIGMSVFVLGAAAGLILLLFKFQRREIQLRRDRSVLAAAYAELEVVKARRDAKAAELEAVLAGMSDAVSVLDRDLRLIHWNELFPVLTGVPEEFLRVGMPMSEIIRAQARAGEFGSVDIEAEVRLRMQNLTGTRRVGTMERARPDGSFIELRRRPLPGGGFVTLYTDITARKHAESQDRLAREAAESRAADKSRFVAIVSHEIRTPLNTLLNSLRILADSTIHDTHRGLVAMAEQASDVLLGLINDILELSKIEAGRLSIHPSTFALRPMLAGVVDLFQAQARARDITLSVAVTADVPVFISADRNRLRQVLINLVSNACKFAARGDVLLAASTEIAAEAGAECGRPFLRLAVEDQGPVIAERDRVQLFQPFTQIDGGEGGTTGTGLGLTICEKLVTLMDGRIGHAPSRATVDKPVGNAFWITLPLSPTGNDAPQQESLFRRGVPRTRILVVDDVPANQLVTSIQLRRAGHLVDIARNGAECIRMLDRQPYDIVLMDVFMPELTGLETTARVRRLPSPACDVPIVALTANVTPEDRTACLAAGMQDVLTKPTAIAGLIDAIARHVWRLPSSAPWTDALENAEVGEGLADRDARHSPLGGIVHVRPTASASSPPEATDRPISGERVDELLRNLPHEQIGPLIESCLEDLRDRIPMLLSAIASGTPQVIEVEAHAMTGIAAGYGLAELENRLRIIIMAAREHDMAVIREQGGAIDSALDRATILIREAIGREWV